MDSKEKQIEVIISYKHPKRRKLVYITIVCDSVNNAIKRAPREIIHNSIGGYILYGIH